MKFTDFSKKYKFDVNKANDRPETWGRLFSNVYTPETQKELDELLETDAWLDHIAETAKKIQPNINQHGINSCISGIVGKLLFSK